MVQIFPISALPDRLEAEGRKVVEKMPVAGFCVLIPTGFGSRTTPYSATKVERMERGNPSAR